MTFKPKLFPNPDETIHGVGHLLRTGELTCTQVLERCLANIDEWEPKVHAWVLLDREGALEQARKLDQEARSSRWRGPLHGIPIGIKDIIDVAGWPTAAGFKPWKDRIAAEDAPIVAKLRDAGAIILGKTVTTQFASFDPPVTRNPWNLERTPGGSSSGSAAAVACGMCLGALGTQTGGSITRPAAYCGVAGFKAPHAIIDLEGILPLAPSMDHLGTLARTVRDLALLFNPLVKFEAHRFDLESHDEISSPRLGRLRGFFDEMADATVRKSMDQAIETLKSAGAEIVEVPWPTEFDDILRHHRIIMGTEAAALHEPIMAEYPSEYAPKIRSLVEEGGSFKASEYVRSQRQQLQLLEKFWEVARYFESPRLSAVIVAATPSTAPASYTTGDPAFNSPWSFLGVPTISLPISCADDGLPLAMQFVGMSTQDEVFSPALWCERVIRETFTRTERKQPI